MKQNEKLLLTSFIFTIFVVWLHAGEPLLSYVPGQVAVPGFFMLSGYLFMKGIPSDDAAAEKEAVRGKLKRRVNTLVLPYLLWNAIYFVIYLVTGRAQIGELFEAVFLYRCNPVFWYMFQLILITVLAPVIYYIMKKGRRAALILLAAIFTLAVLYAKLPFHYCNEDALFYYCLGGYLTLRERYHASAPFRSFVILVAATAAFLLVRGVLPADLRNVSEVGYRAAGALAVYFLTDLVYEKKGGIEVRPWMKVNFFVYATHYMIIRIIWAL
ncbi:MAG: acyltransferase, partial [Lachnospiraceae bacterium]|nr:acyltransferase [Candidatus Hippenecus merdae]